MTNDELDCQQGQGDPRVMAVPQDLGVGPRTTPELMKQKGPSNAQVDMGSVLAHRLLLSLLWKQACCFVPGVDKVVFCALTQYLRPWVLGTSVSLLLSP